MSFIEVISPIEDVIEEARNGRMVILVDDEDRENEGDLVIPAQMATPEVINFMAKHARGLICLALTQKRVEQLKLPLMPQQNASRLRTAFTVSIEAREGVTTGISAPDRARTIATAIDPSKGPEDIVTPGHIFPLMAREGGVLVRTGHTEAAVDIARLAGLNPSGVICEIMNDDGTMARRPDLVRFAQFHGIKMATIADLIAYRRRHDHLVERRLETSFDSKYGGAFKLYIYVNTVAYVEHVALVKGDISTLEPVPVRMHALNVLEDVLGSNAGGRGGVLQEAMEMIAEMGRGVVVLLREPTPTSLLDRMRVVDGTVGPPVPELRDYGVGAQILIDLGVREMILLSTTHRTIVGLEGYGLTVVEERRIGASRSGAVPSGD
ncbi:MAG: 3,4-dihydroxy-2-butanone-4-phosphate synthase [Alphaproteobacteria bacterium]|nr:3,4-dihydroxy-2-butanone-4-phosphate synthase [Alphaproteobacteria bacterium]